MPNYDIEKINAQKKELEEIYEKVQHVVDIYNEISKQAGEFVYDDDQMNIGNEEITIYGYTQYSDGDRNWNMREIKFPLSLMDASDGEIRASMKAYIENVHREEFIQRQKKTKIDMLSNIEKIKKAIALILSKEWLDKKIKHYNDEITKIKKEIAKIDTDIIKNKGDPSDLKINVKDKNMHIVKRYNSDFDIFS